MCVCSFTRKGVSLLAKSAELKRLKNSRHNLLLKRQQAWAAQKAAWLHLQSVISASESRSAILRDEIGIQQRKLSSIMSDKHHYSAKSANSCEDLLLTLAEDYQLISEKINLARIEYLQIVDEVCCIKIEFAKVDQEFQTELAACKSKKRARYYESKSIASQAGVSKKYLDQILIKKSPNGTTHIFFGGIGKPAGPRHGHYVINPNNRVVYKREPFAARGKQNLVKD